ncbi:MAG: lipopolysaccharide biosynthesis protein [Culicoidibacterales bacterium]
MKNNLVSKFLQFAIGPLGGAAISFITIPVTTWLVSPEQFGLTTMFTLFQTLLTSFVYLGIDQAYVREYNEYKGEKQVLLFNAALVPLGIAITIMVSLILFMQTISQYLFAELNYLVMIALVIWIPFVVIERFLLLNIRMQEKGMQYSFFSILVKLLIMIMTITLLLSFERTYTAIILGTILGQILANIILIIASWKTIQKVKYTLDRKLLRRMIRFGLPILPAMVITWLLNSTDRLVLDYFSTVENIGIYFAAMNLAAALSMVQGIFATFWVPIAYRWNEEKVPVNQFTQVSYLVTVLMGVLFIGLLFVKELAVMILSPDYSQAQYILPFLLFMPIMYTMSETTVLGIALARKTHWNIWISFFAAIANIVINLLLVPYLGAIGAAIGTGTAYIVFFWLRTLISRRYWYKFNLTFYMVNTIFLLIIASLNVIIQTKEIYFINFSSLFLFLAMNFIFLAKIFPLDSYFKKIVSAQKIKEK